MILESLDYVCLPFSFLLTFILEPRKAAHVHITVSLIGRGQCPTGTVKEVPEWCLSDRSPLRDLNVLVIWADGGNILVVWGIRVGEGDGARFGQGKRYERHTGAVLEGLHPDDAAIEEGHGVPFSFAVLVEQEFGGRLRWKVRFTSTSWVQLWRAI